MGRMYPVWNEVEACIYKSSAVTHRLNEDGSREYRFYVDGEIVKKATLEKGSSQLQFAI